MTRRVQKRKNGRYKNREEQAYSDDFVLMAENEEDMGEMIKRLQRFLKKRKLELNVEE